MTARSAPSAAVLFAGMPVAAIVIDDGDRIVRANGAAETMLNQSERSLAGARLAAVLAMPPGCHERREGHGFSAFDVEISTSRGHRLRVDLVDSALIDHPGWHILLLHNSPQARRGGDRSGARSAIGAAAMLAHEIKNPLSGIRGAAQLLAGERPENGELARLIQTEVDRIAALIDRMQNFTDTRPARTESVNIYPLLAHAKAVAQAGFAADIAVDERFDPSLPPALADRDAFQQVMLNLLKNAAEALVATPEPRITIATAYRHGMSVHPRDGGPKMPLPIEIMVIDNGPGVPDEIADHLFEPFVSGKPEGQGLGLPLVEKLIGGMGGIVQYAREEKPPCTCFRMLLPRGEG